MGQMDLRGSTPRFKRYLDRERPLEYFAIWSFPLVALHQHPWRPTPLVIVHKCQRDQNLEWGRSVDSPPLPSWRRGQESLPPLRELHARSISFSLLLGREGSILRVYEQYHDGADDFQSLGPGRSIGPAASSCHQTVPGHDARIEVQEGSQNRMFVDIRFEFSDPTDCDSVTQSMSFNVPSSGCGSTPMIAQASVRWLTMDPKDVPPTAIPGVSVSKWYRMVTLNNVPDGILMVTIKDPESQAGASTGVSRS